MPSLLIPNISDDVFARLVEHAKQDGVTAGEEAARIVENALPVARPTPKMDFKEYLMTMPEIEDEFLIRPRRTGRQVTAELFDD